MVLRQNLHACVVICYEVMEMEVNGNKACRMQNMVYASLCGSTLRWAIFIYLFSLSRCTVYIHFNRIIQGVVLVMGDFVEVVIASAV